MSSRNYWLDLFTGKTWEEFQAVGANISGFRESRWKTVQKINKGDYLLCYVTGISRFIAVLEVISEPFEDDSPIWSDEYFPCRVRVRHVVELTVETAVPVHELRSNLSFFQNLKSPHAWTGHFRSSPARWKDADGGELSVLWFLLPVVSVILIILIVVLLRKRRDVEPPGTER